MTVAHQEVGVSETPRRFNLEDAIDTALCNIALNLTQTKPSGAAFFADFRTSINAE